MIKLNSINFKISVLYVLLLGLILVFFSGILYGSVRYILYRNLDRELWDKAHEITEMINAYVKVMGPGSRSVKAASRKVIRLEGVSLSPRTRNEIEERLLKVVDKYELKEDYAQLTDAKGVTIVRSEDQGTKLLDEFLRVQNAVSKKGGLRSPRYQTVGNFRLIRMPVVLKDKKAYILQIATSLEDIDRILQEWLVFIGTAIPVIIFFASFLGRIFVVQILKPVHQIADTAEKISHEDLALRVQAEGVDEEMKHLVNAFNEMISRLETSFKHIQEFSSHVAHELKTPLAVIRGESELALRKEREPAEYRRALESNLKETDRMIKVIEDLLLLSRLEYESEVYRFESFDLVKFLEEIREQSEILSASKEIEVALEPSAGPLFLKGDPLHLRRLFLNLIDNAIKFTPSGGRIHLRISKRDSCTEVTVSDNGAGIAPADLPRIFDKFFHRDRNGAVAGNGLGLAIAQSIARAHRGTIEVASQPDQGATFTVVLPSP